MKRLLLLALLAPSWALADLRYTLSPDPVAKQVRVSVVLDSAGAHEQFEIPSWAPGFYTLLKYSDKISDFKAVDPQGQPLVVTHSSPTIWSVANPSATPITISYRVLGDDAGLGFFWVSVLKDTAFVNGPAAFMYAPSHMTEKAHLEVKLPPGWDIATAMDSDGQAGGYVANGYDELVDHPIQMGKFQRRRFIVEGIPFEAVYVTKDQPFAADLDQATERLRKLSIPAVRMFKGAPFKRYLYVIHLAIGDFAGGLEHRATNVQAVPNAKPLELDDLATHEFFHAWNVKQIRPAILGPFDYTRPQRTGNLWFSEGVTDYYAKLHTYQAGVQDVDWLLDQLSGQISELETGKTRLTKTVEDASREVWEAGGVGYVGDLSYYVKGLVIGLIFDAVIRSETAGKKSLDDVMRLMYARYRLPKPGFQDDGVLQAINEVTGDDASSIYRNMVRTTYELPYDLLGGIGLRLIAPGQRYKSVGFELLSDRKIKVLPEGAASGLQNGDVLVSVAGAPLQSAGALSVKPGDSFRVVVERDGKRRTVDVPITAVTARAYDLQIDPFAAGEAVAQRIEWLRRLSGVENSDHKQTDGHHKARR